METRQQTILHLLEQHKTLTIEELGNQLHYSRSTIRRDLLELERMGLLSRGHGYVTLLTSSAKEKPYRLRDTEFDEEKQTIARLAVDFLSDGLSMFLDAGTTIQRLCPHLSRYHNLTVVTNGLETARTLTEAENPVGLFLTGGYWRQGSMALVGEPAIDYIAQFQMDLCFFSCCGMDENGLYEASMQQSYVKKAMMQHAHTTIVFCDHSKFEHPYKFRLSSFSGIDYILTDCAPQPALLEAAAKAHCEFLYPGM